MTTFTRTRSTRVAIVGSRHFTDKDYRRFAAAIRPLLGPWYVIVSGAAKGIDTLARRYARQNDHELVEYPVDLQLVRRKELEGLDRNAAFGFAARERNSLIVADADRMLAFVCEHSRGTHDSIRKMRRKLQISDTGSDVRCVVWLWDCNQK